MGDQFTQADFDLLKKYDVNPSRVILEVTEGVLMESTDRNRQILDAVRALAGPGPDRAGRGPDAPVAGPRP